MTWTKSTENLGMLAFLLCSTGISLLANQISSPKRSSPWTNQKIGFSMRSLTRPGHSGMEMLNSSFMHQGNISKSPYSFLSFETYQARNDGKVASIDRSNFSSSSFNGKNESEDGLRFIQFDQQPNFDLDNRHANFQQGECKYPCPCTPSSAPPVCKAGVNTVMDGCGCCPQCGRQMGDLCNFRDKCDDQKSLYCDFKLDGGFRGYCRARNPRACNISGKTIIDGQTYQPNCSLICTCQDGKYACSSLCPQELRPPSPTYCRDAQLVRVKDQCCREWVCPNPHNYPSLEDTLSSQYPNEKACNKEVTEWSMCSVSCGQGESIRVTSDNEECQARQERRLCIVRPCGPMDELTMEQQPDRRKDSSHHTKTDPGKKHSKNNLSVKSPSVAKCRATIESPKWENIHYEECISEQTFQLRYCSTCRKCCGPEKTRTVEVKFNCPENKTLLKPFMFIEKCVCYKAKNCPFS